MKACYGHTEGTAGIHGALLSILMANSRAAAPIMQLRSVNPYVSAALSDWRRESRVEPIVPRVRCTLVHLACTVHSITQLRSQKYICKQVKTFSCCAPSSICWLEWSYFPTGRWLCAIVSNVFTFVCIPMQEKAVVVPAEGQAAGVSSFGMSGVNAHGLFTSPPELRAAPGAPLQWQGSRHWPLAIRHNLLLSMSAGAGVARYCLRSIMRVSCTSIWRCKWSFVA